MSQSRTTKSLLNSSISFVFYILSIAVTFFSRRVVLNSLGAEMMGLRGTTDNLLSVVNLAELGVGVAIAYALYKPLHNNDRETINEIVSVQAWFYRKVALVVLTVSIILMMFFPLIFAEIKAPMIYTYLTFSVFLAGTLLSYLVTYRAIVFYADQRTYRLTINIQGFLILKRIFQIIVLLKLPNTISYYIYLGLELVISFIGAYVLERMIQKDYPWLNPKPQYGRALLKKHQEIVKKTKEIFIHKFAGVTKNEIAPVIMFSFASLEIVGFYTSYVVLSKQLRGLINTILGSINAGIGSLVAEGNHKKVQDFFWEMVALKMLIGTSATFGFYFFANKMIVIWLGNNSEYIIPTPLLLLLAIYLFLEVIRVFELFLNAYGLFHDVWASISEVIITIGGGYLLGYLFYRFNFLNFESTQYSALFGVSLSTIIGTILLLFGWKSIFLFRDGFKISPWIYWLNFLKYVFVSILFLIGGYYALAYLDLDFSTIPLFLFNSIWTTAVFSILLFIVYYIISQGMRDITERFRIIFMYKLYQKIKSKFKK